MAQAIGSLTREERLTLAYAAMAEKGIDPKDAYPPLFRAMARRGVVVRPPLFMPFPALLAFGIGLLLFLFGGVLWLTVVAGFEPGRGPIAGLQRGGWGGVALVSVVFGTAFAIVMRMKAARLALPRWGDL